MNETDFDSLDFGPANLVPFDIDPENCRRAGWTDGPAMTMVDGQSWHFPQVDLALVVTTPGLATAVEKVYHTSKALGLAPGDEGLKSACIEATHHAGRLLLAANYDFIPRPLLGGGLDPEDNQTRATAIAAQLMYEGNFNVGGQTFYALSAHVAARSLHGATKGALDLIFAESTPGAGLHLFHN